MIESHLSGVQHFECALRYKVILESLNTLHIDRGAETQDSTRLLIVHAVEGVNSMLASLPVEVPKGNFREWMLHHVGCRIS